VGKAIDELGSVAEKPDWESSLALQHKASLAWGRESIDLAIEGNVDIIVRAPRAKTFLPTLAIRKGLRLLRSQNRRMRGPSRPNWSDGFAGE